MNPHLLSTALGQEHQLRRSGESQGVFKQRAELAPQRAARNIRQPESILDDRVIRAADFERALARADVQAGLAMQVAGENQFPDQPQLSLSCMCAHSSCIYRFTVIRYKQRWLQTGP